MPSYKYEAMDHAGAEVTGTIDAESEGEAQQLIREQDLFVTKITEEGRKKKKKKDPGRALLAATGASIDESWRED